MSKKSELEQLFEEYDKEFYKLKDIIPKSNDVTLVALKGHLVIERMLHRILISHVQNPKYIEKARLTFAQLLSVVMAILLIPTDHPHFSGIRKLNSLRNNLAHNLPNKQTDKLISELSDVMNIEGTGRNEAQRVYEALEGIAGMLSIVGPASLHLLEGADPKDLIDTLRQVGAHS